MLRPTAASLYLDEGDYPPIQRHDVQLPVTRAPVSRQDLEAVRLQVASGDILASPRQAGGFRERLR
jgi:hypothetical protein